MFHNSKKNLRIKTMTVYKKDIVITYTTDIRPETTGGKKKQGRLSAKSIKNLTFYAQNTSVKFQDMITLTYPNEYPESGKVIKSHLNTFLSWCRGKFKPFSYLWFLEFQRRGAPHFHILTSVELVKHKKEVSLRWYETVQSNDIKHLKAGTRVEKLRKVDGAASYATYYASKMYQKTTPDGFKDVGNWWGASRDVRPQPKEVYNLQGMTGQDLRAFMRSIGWEYWQSLTRPLTILYNASEALESIRPD
jgi:hypothetical protein